MNETENLDGNYRIEVSGWGSDQNFFVEQTELFWDRSGDKKVLLHHSPSEGGIVFIRLLSQDWMGNTSPVAYQVAAVQSMDCNGHSEVRLRQLHPRTKVSQVGVLASYAVEDCQGICEPKDLASRMEHEEILQ